MAAPLTVEQYKVYADIPVDDDSSDEAIQDAIDTETSAQGRTCRLEDPYPVDLLQALKRRVARNLALRPLPLMMPRGDAQSGPLFMPGRDPEVRRLEGPFRKVLTG